MKALLWILAGAGLALLLPVGWILLHRPWDPSFCWSCVRMERHSHERPVSGHLKSLATAQADFRANDRDGDGKEGFWRADVAGLYGSTYAGSTDRIKLIDVSVAGADARPTGDVTAFTRRAPKAGYWYQAIRHVDEDPTKLDPQRFAFCAYPEDPARKRWMFAISEGHTIFKAPAVKGGVDVFPTLEELKAGWSKLD